MNFKKTIYIIIGIISLTIGAIAAAIPLLPSFPFLLISALCFAQSSEKIHTWFLNTNLYKKNLESYLKKEGMTIHAKIRVISFITISMGIGCYFLIRSQIIVGIIILVIVWLSHLIYFIFFVKTIKSKIEIT